jgi:hypothetical protein
MSVHQYFPRCLVCGDESYWSPAVSQYRHENSVTDHVAEPDTFDKMTTAALRAYAREHYSSISRGTQRRGLIDAMRYQMSKLAREPV